MSKENLKKILGVLLIAFVVVLTLTFIKRLPPLMKIVSFGANIATIYWVSTIFKNKNKNQKDETEN